MKTESNFFENLDIVSNFAASESSWTRKQNLFLIHNFFLLNF